MPEISKQKPTTNHSKRSLTSVVKAESVLSEAIPVEELQDDWIKMVIYGQNRVGKTYLACQFPKPLLLVSFEPALSGGARTVKKVAGVKYLKLTSKERAIHLAKELALDTFYKTVVVDTCTSLQDIILQELMGLEEQPIQLWWGSVGDDNYKARSEQAKEVLRYYVNLPKHTVILAKEKDHNPPKGDRTPKMLRQPSMGSFFSADLGSATAGWLADACDYICQLFIAKEVKTVTKTVKIQGKEKVTREEVETGRKIRRLRTQLDDNYAGGFRSHSPEKVPEFIDEPTFEKILKAINGD